MNISSKFYSSINTCLNGYSQVMLQNNRFTGFLFLLGILINSWTMALGSLLGVVIASFSARMLKYSEQNIKDGIYGFNGVLVGVASVFYLGFNYVSLCAIIPFAFLSSLLTHYFLKFNIPPLTAPFVICTWALLTIDFTFDAGSLPISQTTSLYALGRGIGQVMFQANALSGTIFLLGLAISSWLIAFFGLLGSLVGLLIAAVLFLPEISIDAGLYGYNAVLCGIVFAGKTKRSFGLSIFAMILSVIITYLMMNLSFVVLTAPFILSTWSVMLINRFQTSSETQSSKG